MHCPSWAQRPLIVGSIMAVSNQENVSHALTDPGVPQYWLPSGNSHCLLVWAHNPKRMLRKISAVGKKERRNWFKSWLVVLWKHQQP